jgi:hypothetical protein
MPVHVELVKTDDEVPAAVIDAMAELLVRNVLEARRCRLEQVDRGHRDIKGGSGLREEPAA